MLWFERVVVFDGVSGLCWWCPRRGCALTLARSVFLGLRLSPPRPNPSFRRVPRSSARLPTRATVLFNTPSARISLRNSHQNCLTYHVHNPRSARELVPPPPTPHPARSTSRARAAGRPSQHSRSATAESSHPGVSAPWKIRSGIPIPLRRARVGSSGGGALFGQPLARLPSGRAQASHPTSLIRPSPRSARPCPLGIGRSEVSSPPVLPNQSITTH